MALVQSLLTAIVRADGDALVMHVGERPYVIASAGTIELSTHGLNLEAMSGMLGQLLPHEALRALNDFGAIEHTLVPPTPIPGERFSVVAARGGDDVWIELRRHRRAKDAAGAAESAHVSPAPPEPTAEAASVSPAPAPAADAADAATLTAPLDPLSEPAVIPPDLSAGPGPDLEVIEIAVSVEASLSTASTDATPPSAVGPELQPAPAPVSSHDHEGVAASDSDPGQPPAEMAMPAESMVLTPPAAVVSPGAAALAGSPAARESEAAWPASTVPAASAPPTSPTESESRASSVSSAAPPVSVPSVAPAASVSSVAPTVPVSSPSSTGPFTSAPSAAPLDRWAVSTPASDDGAVVVPMTRAMRIESGPRGLSSRPGGIDRLLRVAASRGASALYLSSEGRPYVRVDGDIRLLEGEPVLTTTDVESAVLELMPESVRDALRRGQPTEWVSDLADIGRIRCTTFSDYRGPGALFQMISARAASAEQLGLSREIQALANESEGLVVVAGPRGSGKSALVAAFVDLVNRRRADYVITLERQIRLVHDNRSSLISQREVRGSAEEVVAQARAALRENPDVLVLEDVRSPDVLQVALDAAGSGLLVFISVTAASAMSAVERMIDLAPIERKRPVQALLGETLRGVVAQVLLRKSGSGRLAARELLLNTAAVASLVTEGQTSQLPLAIDSGRRHGMVPLNDALVAFVQSGAVDVREVYRKAADRAGLLTLLKREGIDTSFAERLA